jgi:hypothetical protein
MTYLGGQGGYVEKLSYGSETSDMISERLGKMFKGDSADRCAGKFPLVSMGGRADTSSMRRRGARTPIGVSGIHIEDDKKTFERKTTSNGRKPQNNKVEYLSNH